MNDNPEPIKIGTQGLHLQFHTLAEIRRSIHRWSQMAEQWEEDSAERRHCYAVAADLTDYLDKRSKGE